MNKYRFVSTDDFKGVQQVTANFETESLDTVVEKFFWFLAASGFHYIGKIAIDDHVVVDIHS